RYAITAALSATSPTHSNGLCSCRPHSWANPSPWVSSFRRLRPNMPISSAFAMNGERARKTNRHFGQSQHHSLPRVARDCRKAVLQLRKIGKYFGYFEKRRAISISDNGRSNEKYAMLGDM